MTTVLAELYDALLSAGAPEDKARAAAAAIADYDSRFSKIEADLLVLKWMTGTMLAAVIATLIRVFRH